MYLPPVTKTHIYYKPDPSRKQVAWSWIQYPSCLPKPIATRSTGFFLLIFFPALWRRQLGFQCLNVRQMGSSSLSYRALRLSASRYDKLQFGDIGSFHGPLCTSASKITTDMWHFKNLPIWNLLNLSQSQTCSSQEEGEVLTWRDIGPQLKNTIPSP